MNLLIFEGEYRESVSAFRPQRADAKLPGTTLWTPGLRPVHVFAICKRRLRQFQG